jgi:hypothetical protein
MKQIKGFKRYYINELGALFSCSNGKKYELKQSLRNGYPCVSFWINGKVKTQYVHRLVAQTFIPNPNNKRVVNHINGIKTDNKVLNLEWCTYSENMQHAFDTGLNVSSKCKRNIGEYNAMSKIKSADVVLIINDTRSQSAIAKDYGVSQTIISKIKLRKYWKHID